MYDDYTGVFIVILRMVNFITFYTKTTYNSPGGPYILLCATGVRESALWGTITPATGVARLSRALPSALDRTQFSCKNKHA